MKKIILLAIITSAVIFADEGSFFFGADPTQSDNILDDDIHGNIGMYYETYSKDGKRSYTREKIKANLQKSFGENSQAGIEIVGWSNENGHENTQISQIWVSTTI